MADLIRREPANVPTVYEPRPANIWIDDYLDEKQGEIARYGQIIVKRKWLVLAIAVVMFAGSGAWTMAKDRVYTSSVNIQIDPEQSVLPYQEMYASVTADPKYLNTQAQVLKSEVLARRIVSRLSLATEEPGLTSTARWFKGNVAVTPIEGTQILKVSYRGKDPVFTATAANTLADEYVDYGFDVKRVGTTKAREFLEEELLKLKKKLESSEQLLVNYGRAHGMLPSEGTNVITQKLTDLEQELTKVETGLLSNQYESLKSTTVADFPDRLKTNVMKALDIRRSDLEQKFATAKSQFGPKWPEVVKLEQELTEVRSQLAAERGKIVEQARVEYNLAIDHKRKLTAAITDQKVLTDRLTVDSIEYNILKREVETDRQLHEGLLQKLKQTDVAAGVKSVNVHVIDRAHVPTLPSSPNVPFDLALGLTFGLMSGVMVALAIDFFDRTVKTAEDVERELRLPYLGAIPAFSKRWQAANGGHLVPLSDSREYLPATGDPSAAVYWESYRALRTSLLFSSPENRPRSLLVTSALPGEGKSTTSVNLAIALAQTGARTLLVELDMRRPKIAAIFNLTCKGGISRYLSGQSELNTEIQETAVPNLFIVPGGPVPPNPAELTGSPRMATALGLLQRHFEFVVIDGPPLLAVTDAAVISSQVNGVILVVGGKTSTATVQKARNLLRSVGANILGALVNNVKFDASIHYYAADY